MKKLWIAAALAVGLGAVSLPAQAASASDVAIGFFAGTLLGSAASAPRYYAPPVVYAAPPVTYYSEPVYVAPQSVYVDPQPVYVAPEPVYVAPEPVVVYRPYHRWHHYW